MSTSNDELEDLKAKADVLDVKYSANIGIETLKERIQKAEEELMAQPDEDTEEVPEKSDSVSLNKNISPDDKRKQDIIQKRKEANRLIRVIVTPNQPEKRGLDGDIFSVSNDIISIKKYVPYGNENGWYIPVAIYNLLKEKKFQTFRDEKINGMTNKKGSLIPAFNVHELDNLSEKEIDNLAKAQRARQTIKN